MKRTILGIILGLFIISSANAQKSFTNAQLKLRDEIKSFLQEEGYLPDIDKDGDIFFKKSGIKYFVEISDSSTSPMFVTLSTYRSYTENITKAVIKRAQIELTTKKLYKVIYSDSYYAVKMETYVTNSKMFTDVFSQQLEWLSRADGYIEALL